MLLAIDTGNTNTLFAVHDGKGWRAQWRSATDMTKTADDYAVWLSTLMEMNGLKLDQIDDCIISTVVPQSLFNQRNFARRYLKVEPFVIGENVDLGVKVLERVKGDLVDVEIAVKGMLPKNPLGRAMYRKLKVYKGTEHPHAAQQPQPLDF